MYFMLYNIIINFDAFIPCSFKNISIFDVFRMYLAYPKCFQHSYVSMIDISRGYVWYVIVAKNPGQTEDFHKTFFGVQFL